MRTDIPALIVPGHDAAHATSAARYLEECLPHSDYWDVAVEAQTEDATNSRVLDFFDKIVLKGYRHPMVDYYSILLRAVTAPGAGDARWRRDIYDRSRRMLAGRLRTLNPPPPLPAIAAEEAALEAAIERIEAELSWTEHGAIAPDARTHDRFGDIAGEPRTAREQGLIAAPSRLSRGGWIVIAVIAAALGAGGYVYWVETAQKSAPPPRKTEAQNSSPPVPPVKAAPTAISRPASMAAIPIPTCLTCFAASRPFIARCSRSARSSSIRRSTFSI